jgi:hypothetical protein
VWVRTTLMRTKPRSANTILVGMKGFGPCEHASTPSKRGDTARVKSGNFPVGVVFGQLKVGWFAPWVVLRTFLLVPVLLFLFPILFSGCVFIRIGFPCSRYRRNTRMHLFIVASCV